MKMKAIGVRHPLPIEDPNSLVDIEVDKPTPSGHDLLVKVKAISVNPIDTKIRQQLRKQENNSFKVLGWDVAGVVEETGSEVSLFRRGDEVYYAGDLIRPGGNSEYHLVDERIVGHKPKTLSFAAAASLPLTGITACEALFERLGISQDRTVNKGKSILIIGAAGGVGSIAVQIARQVGLTVIGTASRKESVEWLKRLGVDQIINHHQPFLPQIQNIGINYVNYVFCCRNTENHWKNMHDSIEPQGKICSIVESQKDLNITLLQRKSISFAWEYVFTRPLYLTEDMYEQHQILNRIAQWVDEGKIKSTVTKCLQPICAEKLKLAHKWIESNQMIGKVVIQNFKNQNNTNVDLICKERHDEK